MGKSLNKIVKLRKGKAPQKSNSDKANLVEYLTPEYLRGSKPAELLPSWSSQVNVKQGELILLWDGSNAGEFFKAKTGVLSSTMVALGFDSSEIDSEFLYYALKNFEPYLKAQTNGSGIPHVDKQIFIESEILDIGFKEQKKIGHVLSMLDSTIELIKALIAKHQRIKTGLMQDLLTKGIDEKGNIRSEETHEFQDSPVGRIPVEWEPHCIEYGLNFITDYRGKTPPYVKDGIPALSAENIGDGKVKSITKYVTKEVYDRWLTRQVPEPGDVIFTMEAPVAEVAQLPDNETYLLTRRLIAFNTDPELLINSFLYFTLLFLKQKEVWLKYSHGSTVPRILKPDVLNFIIGYPKKEEQKKICEIIVQQENVIFQEMKNLRKLQRLKIGLMQDLLSGKVSVEPLLKENISQAQL